MLLYNVTVKIEKSVHNEWLRWMLTKHIPEVMATGCFVRNQVGRLISHEEEDGITYALQYYCKDGATLDHYMKEFAPALQQDHRERFGDKFVAFRTVLDLLDLE